MQNVVAARPSRKSLAYIRLQLVHIYIPHDDEGEVRGAVMRLVKLLQVLKRGAAHRRNHFFRGGRPIRMTLGENRTIKCLIRSCAGIFE